MPRAACPVKSEASVTRVHGEHHYHLEKRSGREEVRLLENSLGKNNLAGLTSFFFL